MADQGRWWKLWCSAPDDDDLDNLSIADFGRYCKLGAHIKEHGTSGTIVLKPPCKTLLTKLQLAAFDDLSALVSLLPNVRHSLTSQPHVTLSVTYNNWKKFQEDTSAERTREWRKKKKLRLSHPETTIEEKRRDEMRREVVPPTGVQGEVIQWPEDLREIKTYLTTIHAPPSLDDLSYWQRIEEWMRNGSGYSVAYLDELSAYLAWWEAKPPHQRHKNLKQGLRNWLSKALVMEQNREQKTIFKDRRRPKDAFGRSR